MSFFEPISGGNFGEKLEQARAMDGAVIVDVRSEAEFGEGYVPGARNIPLNQVPALDMPRETPLFLYCRSGARSARGCKALERLGYTSVTNLGGILDYTGPLEK